MEHFFIQSAFFSLFISLIAYQIGLYLKKRTGFALCNPLLIAVILVILLLSLLDIEYESYKKGTNILSMLLTPATICLAVPLYEQVHLLKKHSTAVLAGVISGAVGSMASVAILSFLFHLSHTHYVTLLPKSITTAIGMGVSEELGGYFTGIWRYRDYHSNCHHYYWNHWKCHCTAFMQAISYSSSYCQRYCHWKQFSCDWNCKSYGNGRN